MDISDTLAPTSEQLDSVDLLPGPRTFTIERVSKGNAEQPVQIHLVDFPRPWRPGKSMRRVLVAAWGPDASQYVGRSVRLFCDDSVTFGADRVGGTRISHLSHIDKKLSIPLLVTRGRSKVYTVEPLTVTAQPAKKLTEPTPQQVADCTDVDQLTAWAEVSRPVVQQVITARIAALNPDGRLIPEGLPIEEPR